MEVSLVHESSLLDEQREEARESSIDHFKKPIQRIQGCFGMIFQIGHVTDSESSTYEEEAKHQVWKMLNNVWKVVIRQRRKSVITSKWINKIKLFVDI